MTMRGKGATSSWQSGVSLIELMVALVIGLFLIVGAVMVYSQSRKVYRTIETVARLQETARYALDVMEADVRMASYWGLASRPDYIINGAGPAEDTPADLAAANGITTDSWVYAGQRLVIPTDSDASNAANTAPAE
jgi:prepilin-type N-terminal cleavage/methylation domain-containing protein